MKYNPNVHHRKSIRVKLYNYSLPGMYFITICIQNRKCILSKIKDKRIFLTSYGEIVNQEINNTEKMRKNVRINYYVIMPNHIHMIIEITGEGTRHRAPTVEKFQKPTSNSIPTIIRLFKASVTMKTGRIFQRNYYEHIIRNEKEYYEIIKYIKENPLKWEYDTFYTM